MAHCRGLEGYARLPRSTLSRRLRISFDNENRFCADIQTQLCESHLADHMLEILTAGQFVIHGPGLQQSSSLEKLIRWEIQWLLLSAPKDISEPA
jgi:hypothetical protein